MRSSRSALLEIYGLSVWLWLGGNTILLAGLSGNLGRGTLLGFAFALVGGLVALSVHARAARAALLRAVQARPLATSVLLALLTFEAILGFAPPTTRDALIHHLAFPRLFLQAGRVYDVRFAVQASYPQTVEMLYLLPVGLGVDFVSAWIHLGFGLLAAGVLAARAQRWGGPQAAIPAALLFLSLPVVVTLAGGANIDLALCLYTFLALECFLRWCEAEQRGPWLVLSALAVGFALSTKYSALVIAASLAPLLLSETLRQGGLARAARCLALFGVLTFLPATPWLARNAMLRHDPFYPLFPKLFHVSSFEADNVPPPLMLRRLMYGEEAWQIALLPVRIFVWGKDGDPRRFDGRLNPLLLVLAVGVLLVRGRRHPLPGAWATGLFAALGVTITLLETVARARYALPFAAVLCPLAAASLAIPGRPKLLQPSLASAIFLAALLWNAASILPKLGDQDLLAFLGGRLTREAYLSHKLVTFPVILRANALVPRGGKVQLLFMGDQGYYLDVPYTYESYFSGSGLAHALPGGTDAVKAYFHRQGVTHLLINESILRQFLLGRRFGPEGVRAWEAFLGARAVKLEARGPYALYELMKTPEKQGVAKKKDVKIHPVPADKTSRGS